jgi:methanogenic corrinoid protein MtbC1
MNSRIADPSSPWLRENIGPWAEAALQIQFSRQPELEKSYDSRRKALAAKDMAYHLEFLGQAIQWNSPALFWDYVGWLKVFLPRLGVPVADIAASLESIASVLAKNLLPEVAQPTADILKSSLSRLWGAPDDLTSFIEENAPLALLATRYLQALLRADRNLASRMILEAADTGVSVKDIYLGVFQNVQREIGRLWQSNVISVAQEHYCTAVTQLVMSQLYPRIFSGGKKPLTMVATCVSGELHEIGIRMVADFFEMEGWNTHYLGASMPGPSLLRFLNEIKPHVLCIAATMTFHIDAAASLIREVRSSPAGQDVRILVGGYPFLKSPDLWRKIGADGTAGDARQAVTSAETLVAAP